MSVREEARKRVDEYFNRKAYEHLAKQLTNAMVSTSQAEWDRLLHGVRAEMFTTDDLVKAIEEAKKTEGVEVHAAPTVDVGPACYRTCTICRQPVKQGYCACV